MPATHRPVLAPWWDISENTPPSERKSGPTPLRVYPVTCWSLTYERCRLRARRLGDLFRRNLGREDLPKLDRGSAAQYGSFSFHDGGLMELAAIDRADQVARYPDERHRRHPTKLFGEPAERLAVDAGVRAATRVRVPGAHEHEVANRVLMGLAQVLPQLFGAEYEPRGASAAVSTRRNQARDDDGPGLVRHVADQRAARLLRAPARRVGVDDVPHSREHANSPPAIVGDRQHRRRSVRDEGPVHADAVTLLHTDAELPGVGQSVSQPAFELHCHQRCGPRDGGVGHRCRQ